MRAPIRTPRLTAALVCAVAVTSCGGDRGEARKAKTPETPPEAAAADPLWSFAPEGWMAALVIADGAVPGLDSAMDEGRRIVERVGSGAILERARSLVALPGEIDPLDPSSFEAIGVDTERGLALFVAPNFATALVFSVRDLDQLHTSLSAAATDDGFHDVGGTLCKPSRGRYLCASSRQVWTAIDGAGAQDQPASTRQPAEPQEVDIVIAARSAGGAGLVASLGGPDLGIRSARAELELEGGRLTARAEIDMPPPRRWLPARRRAAPRGFASVDESAFGLLRLRVDPADLRSLPWPRRGPVDLRGVLAPELTGDIAVYSSGRHPFGVHVVAGLRDASAVKLMLRSTCRLASLGGFGKFSWRGNRCEGRVRLAKLGIPGLSTWLPSRVPVFIEAAKGGIMVSLMVPPKPGLPTQQASGRVARRLHDLDWNLSAWGRWSDPEAVLSGQPAIVLRGELARLGMPLEVAAARALLGHVYDAGIGVRATPNGLIAEASVTTYAADPEPVFRSYSDAVIALARGDLPRYLRRLKEIAGRHPDSLVSAQMGVRGLPLAPLIGVSALVERL